MDDSNCKDKTFVVKQIKYKIPTRPTVRGMMRNLRREVNISGRVLGFTLMIKILKLSGLESRLVRSGWAGVCRSDRSPCCLCECLCACVRTTRPLHPLISIKTDRTVQGNE